MRLTKYAVAVAAAVVVSGCNLDIVLPTEDEDEGERFVTVVDLNGRTQNVAVVDGVEQR